MTFLTLSPSLAKSEEALRDAVNSFRGKRTPKLFTASYYMVTSGKPVLWNVSNCKGDRLEVVCIVFQSFV